MAIILTVNIIKVWKLIMNNVLIVFGKMTMKTVFFVYYMFVLHGTKYNLSSLPWRFVFLVKTLCKYIFTNKWGRNRWLHEGSGLYIGYILYQIGNYILLYYVHHIMLVSGPARENHDANTFTIRYLYVYGVINLMCATHCSRKQYNF